MTATASKPELTSMTVSNPATGEPIGEIACFDAHEVEAAVARARAAQPAWAATPVRRRLEILAEFKRLLCEQREQMAAIITREAGKPSAEALGTEVLVVLDCVNYLTDQLPLFLRPESVPHSNPIMKLKRGTLMRA